MSAISTQDTPTTFRFPSSPVRVTADAHRYERRRADRHDASGRVTALVADEDKPFRCGRIGSLQVRNLSRCGLAALSQEPVAVGSRIVVYFEPEGGRPGHDLYGRVVRCRPSVREPWAHEIGIDWDMKRAA